MLGVVGRCVKRGMHGELVSPPSLAKTPCQCAGDLAKRPRKRRPYDPDTSPWERSLPSGRATLTAVVRGPETGTGDAENDGPACPSPPPRPPVNTTCGLGRTASLGSRRPHSACLDRSSSSRSSSRSLDDVQVIDRLPRAGHVCTACTDWMSLDGCRVCTLNKKAASGTRNGALT